MGTTSSNRGISVPTNGGDSGTWGNEVNNGTFFPLDAILGGTTILPSSTYGNAATLTSSQAQTGRIQITGAPSATFVLTLPASNFAFGQYYVQNQTAKQVTVGSALSSGTTVTVQPNLPRLVWADGVNVSPVDQSAALVSLEFQIQAAITGNPISSGTTGFLRMPFGFTITQWTIIASSAGSITLDLLKSSYSGYPGSLASITGTSQPNLNAASKAQDATLTAWTTTLNQNDILQFKVTSSASVNNITLSIDGLRTTPS